MKNIFNKITSELHGVIIRILIVLDIILFGSILIYMIDAGNWSYQSYRSKEVITDEMIEYIEIPYINYNNTYLNLEILFCASIGYWVIVAVVNWILKGKGK
jgi:hypothetical protein